MPASGAEVVKFFAIGTRTHWLVEKTIKIIDKIPSELFLSPPVRRADVARLMLASLDNVQLTLDEFLGDRQGNSLIKRTTEVCLERRGVPEQERRALMTDIVDGVKSNIILSCLAFKIMGRNKDPSLKAGADLWESLTRDLFDNGYSFVDVVVWYTVLYGTIILSLVDEVERVGFQKTRFACSCPKRREKIVKELKKGERVTVQD